MDDNLTEVLIVAISILGLICLRYLKLRARSAGQMSTQEIAAVEQMGQIAQRLEARVATLERILDAEVPDWRGKQPDNFYRKAV
jgi:phage shock protein B